jgi:hypothetical protein
MLSIQMNRLVRPGFACGLEGGQGAIEDMESGNLMGKIVIRL